jgi:hypothetical protein
VAISNKTRLRSTPALDKKPASLPELSENCSEKHWISTGAESAHNEENHNKIISAAKPIYIPRSADITPPPKHQKKAAILAAGF